MITAFVDCPQHMALFCRQWNIPRPLNRPCVIICSECRGQMQLMLVADTEISDQDGKLLLLLELEHRRWIVLKDGKPICPNCRHD